MAITVCGHKRIFGLALSGGGFRATLFHLGVLRRLHELGLHENIDYISSVSGGSIVAALYCWKKPRNCNEFERQILRGVRLGLRDWWLLIIGFIAIIPLLVLWDLHACAQLRTFCCISGLLWFGLILLVVYLPAIALVSWSCFDPMNWLFRCCLGIGRRVRLDATAPGAQFSPLLLMNATCLNTGRRWVFSPCYVGQDEGWNNGDVDEILQGRRPTLTLADPVKVPLTDAILASAAFPGFFAPRKLSLDKKLCTRAGWLRKVKLVDGGVYDNQGFRIFLRRPREGAPESRINYLIASDAAQPFSERRCPAWEPVSLGNLSALGRSGSIQSEDSRDEAYDLLFSQQDLKSPQLSQFALFSIRGKPAQSKRNQTAPYALPQGFGDELAKMRTDFDYFSSLEIRALMYHGYTLANHRIFNYCYELLEPGFHGIKAIIKPLVKPLDWQDLRHHNGLPNASLPTLDSWAEFNEKLTRDHPCLLWTLWPCRRFLALNNFGAPASAIVDQARRYLSHSGSRFLLYRMMLRLWDWSWLGKVIVSAVVIGLGVVAWQLLTRWCCAT